MVHGRRSGAPACATAALAPAAAGGHAQEEFDAVAAALPDPEVARLAERHAAVAGRAVAVAAEARSAATAARLHHRLARFDSDVAAGAASVLPCGPALRQIGLMSWRRAGLQPVPAADVYRHQTCGEHCLSRFALAPDPLPPPRTGRARMLSGV